MDQQEMVSAIKKFTNTVIESRKKNVKEALEHVSHCLKLHDKAADAAVDHEKKQAWLRGYQEAVIHCLSIIESDHARQLFNCIADKGKSK